MAQCEKRSRGRLRSMDLLKLALIVITLSGVYLFMMVHRIENPFPKADLSLPIKFDPDLQWNDSLIEGMEKRQEISDLLENDDSFKDLFNFHTDSSKENTSSQLSSQRKSNLRKRRKSRRMSKMRIESNRRGTLDSRNVSISEQKLAPTASRRFSDDRRKSVDSKETYQRSVESHSDSERRPDTTKSSRRFNNDQSTNPGKERFKQSSWNVQIAPREKESINFSNEETKQLETLQSENDERKPKVAKHEDPYLLESQSAFQQQTKHKIPSSSQRNNSHSTTQGINHGKLQEKSNDRFLENNQTFNIKHEPFLEPKYDVNLKGNIAKPKSLYTQDDTLNQFQKARSKLEQHSDKVASKQHKDTSHPKRSNNKQDSDPLPSTSSEKRRSLLIFGDDRSGTTFVTKMFAADPQMFTVYEPLWIPKKWFSQLRLIDDQKVKFTVDVVNALLSCQFTRSKAGTTFLAYTSKPWVSSHVFPKFIFRTASFANKTKSGKRTWPQLYHHPEFAEQVCLNRFNHSVVKVGQIRVPGEKISVFIPRVLEANPDTDIRVLQIVRDPRGSINSRIKNGWISDFTYTGFPQLVGNLCSKIERNIEFGRSLSTEWLKERYMEITYREITTMPITTAKKIYKFAGFEMPDSLIDWIVESTNPGQHQLQQALTNPFSHVRDSSKNNLKWRRESPIKRVRVIEEHCKNLLDLLGLDEVADEMETLCS